MRTVVLVPRRADNGRRDQVWSWVRGRWHREHPDWHVVEGHHDEGKFNRSAAINTAAREAGDWDVAVIADADSFVGTEQIDKAVLQAVDGGFWLAYDRFCYLSKAMSDKVMDGYSGMWESGVEWWLAGTCSTMVVVNRDLWEQARGFDEGFVGWGCEDIAASHAFQTFGDGLHRVPGAAWHLWHPMSVENNKHDPDWLANLERAKRYQQVAYDRDGMTALLDELGR